MSTTHELKTHPQPYFDVFTGEKPYEIRKNDRGYAVGDWLLLKQWEPVLLTYSGKQLWAYVTHLTPGGQWGLPAELCVLGIQLPETWTPRRLLQAICDDISKDLPVSRASLERFFHDRPQHMLLSELDKMRELLDLRVQIRTAIEAAHAAGNAQSWQAAFQEGAHV